MTIVIHHNPDCGTSRNACAPLPIMVVLVARLSRPVERSLRPVTTTGRYCSGAVDCGVAVVGAVFSATALGMTVATVSAAARGIARERGVEVTSVATKNEGRR